eukprot:6230503-Prymnesium_polylepis.2
MLLLIESTAKPDDAQFAVLETLERRLDLPLTLGTRAADHPTPPIEVYYVTLAIVESGGNCGGPASVALMDSPDVSGARSTTPNSCAL